MTTTEKLHVAVRFNASVAMHSTPLDPTGNMAPDSGEHETVTGFSPAVVAGASKLTMAGPDGGAVVETLLGQVTAGGSLTRVTGGGLFDALGALGLLHSSQNATVNTTVNSQTTRARIPLNYDGLAPGGLF
ncbi:MAG TPA: hypothetical protein VL919_11845, partial [Vicinamibacterales bacterium]|nr:hypothetical protein [Vicinamibacterales bacterium]